MRRRLLILLMTITAGCSATEFRDPQPEPDMAITEPAEPTCGDGELNGKETDVDCGGPECEPCPPLKACSDGADCGSRVCADGQCVAGTCSDGVMNGTETNVDCGGPACPVCSTEADTGPPDAGAMPRCDDAMHNGEEADVDCGGPDCDPCGDGRRCTTAEDCDSGVCDETCQPPSCGDGVINAGEGCDDGNADDTDDCVACQPAECGDGHVHAVDEECDDGNGDDDDACVAGCLVATCGDGFVHAGVEACDDGNGDTTDDCPDGPMGTCEPARCGDGFVDAANEGCDDGNEIVTDDCPDGPDGTCEPATCGDGFVNDAEETCDDGNHDTTDACPDGPNGQCIPAYCGDEFVEAGAEDCDEGGDTATCDGDCSPTECGDGYVNPAAGEQCEDGNMIDGDGCDANCQYEPRVYEVTQKTALFGLDCDCSMVDTYPYNCCNLGQPYGFSWVDSTPFTPSDVRIEFLTGNWCSSNRVKDPRLNGTVAGSYVLEGTDCQCAPPTGNLNVWDLWPAGVSAYAAGGLNTLAIDTLDGCEGIALEPTDGFYARITVFP